MKKQKSPTFYRFYKGLMMAFDLPESAFMVYMADLDALRNLGHNTVRPLNAHLHYLGIGRRSFERCVTKSISMGLLKRIPVDGMYDYIWDMRVYERLVRIVSSTNSYTALRPFCRRVFEDESRNVMSVTEDEICELRGIER